MHDIRFVPDLRTLETIPENLLRRFEAWRGARFVWKQWNRPHENWTHDHCEACFACICDHRERFPGSRAYEERGCYRHSYYAEDGRVGHLWVYRSCFKRLAREFDWSIAAPGN